MRYYLLQTIQHGREFNTIDAATKGADELAKALEILGSDNGVMVVSVEDDGDFTDDAQIANVVREH